MHIDYVETQVVDIMNIPLQQPPKAQPQAPAAPQIPEDRRQASQVGPGFYNKDNKGFLASLL